MAAANTHRCTSFFLHFIPLSSFPVSTERAANSTPQPHMPLNKLVCHSLTTSLWVDICRRFAVANNAEITSQTHHSVRVEVRSPVGLIPGAELPGLSCHDSDRRSHTDTKRAIYFPYCRCLLLHTHVIQLLDFYPGNEYAV